MAMVEKDRKQLLGFLIGIAVLGAGAFWYFWYQGKSAEAAVVRVQIDSLQAGVDSARQDLARGSIESLRRRVVEYEASAQLMRRLVPEGGEVANLIDDVASKAKLRGVEIGQLTPLAVEDGSPFQTHRYRFQVIGHFDALGEFLSDVASLPRIMVPQDISLTPASQTAARAYGDTTGALVEATFQLRTFVKLPSDSLGEAE